MTLVVTIITEWGIWQSCDYRLSQNVTGKWGSVDDWSPKHVGVKCPDGKALISYTGCGRVSYFGPRIEYNHSIPAYQVPAWVRSINAMVGRRLEAPVSEWVIRILHGETRSIDDSLIRLREAATANAILRRTPTVFPIGAYFHSTPWLVLITNAQARRDWFHHPPRRKFETYVPKIDIPGYFIAGAVDAVVPEDRVRLGQIIRRRPRRSSDYFELLANINRNAARRRRDVISEACHVSYISPDPSEFMSFHIETWGQELPAEAAGTRMLLYGIELLSGSREMPERLRNVGYEVPELVKRQWDLWEVRRYAPTVVRGFIDPDDTRYANYAFYAEVTQDCRGSFRVGQPSQFTLADRTADQPTQRVNDGAAAELEQAEHRPEVRVDREYDQDDGLPNPAVDCGDPANAQWIILDLYRRLK